ncbi:MAG: heavy-metal-associated domain-containing protein [Lachnospiraceae bacterium]|nr:heavy-metal-associated domain-containing protein [Lachnospiraceae bacterium]
MVSNIIIIVILAVALFFAIKSTVAHFKGQGACCGGGGSDVKTKPRKLDTVMAQKVMRIDGMHCEHCYTRVQNVLNSIDGISARVIGSRKLAVIKYGKEVSDDTLVKAVTDLGYEVRSIQ